MKVTMVMVVVAAALLLRSGTLASQEPVDPSTWSYDTGYTYCLYSYAAYCSEESIQLWTCSWCQQNSTVSGFNTTMVYVQDGELGYIGFNSQYQQIVVTFRGSTDTLNWLNDFDATQTDYPYCSGCLVHKGFYDTWLHVKQDVLSEVWRLHQLYPSYVVVTTGHSLGAALATLAGPDVAMNVSKTKVYTWNLGSPRVGNHAFSLWYQSSGLIVHSQRIVNNRDIVPHNPAEDLNYYHVVQEAWEQKNPVDFIICDPNNGEDPTCSDSVIGDSTEDHLTYFGLYESCSS